MSVGSLGIRVFTSAIPGRLAHGLQRVQVPCQTGRHITRARGSPSSSYFRGCLNFRVVFGMAFAGCASVVPKVVFWVGKMPRKVDFAPNAKNSKIRYDSR